MGRRVVSGDSLCNVRALVCRRSEGGAQVGGGVPIVKCVDVDLLFVQRYYVVRARAVDGIFYCLPWGAVTRNLLGVRFHFADARLLCRCFGERVQGNAADDFLGYQVDC